MRMGLLSSVGRTLDAFFPQLVHEWTSEGVDVLTAAGTEVRFQESRVLHGLGQRPGLGSIRAVSAIRKWVADERLDVLVTNTAVASFLARVRPLGVPVVYFCHGLHWTPSSGVSAVLWKGLERRCLSNTAGVLTMNSDDRAWFATRFDSRRLGYLRYGVGVPLDRFAAAPLPCSPPLRLLWAGAFVERKRPHLAVEVMHGLAERGVAATLRMIGTGPLVERTQELVRSRGLTDIIEVAGHQDMAAELASSHVLIHTAEWEGLPRVGLEAYAMGRPVVSFDVKGARDLPNARIVRDGDSRAMTTLLAESSRLPLHEVSAPDADLGTRPVAGEVLAFVRAILADL